MSKLKGFTLIELLVVVTIISILSLIGYTIYSNVRDKAKDAKRRVDIDTIAKAYEKKFNPLTGEYQRFNDADFADDKIPQDPAGSSYFFLRGPYSGGDEICKERYTRFKVCAALSNAPSGATCNPPDPTYCYCKYGSFSNETPDTCTYTAPAYEYPSPFYQSPPYEYPYPDPYPDPGGGGGGESG